MTLVPTVIEREGNRERVQDIFSRMLKERVVFVTDTIDSHLASIVCAQLLFLESENPTKDIHMYINSPGGLATAGLAMYDCMQFIRPDVSTMCIGHACSAGSLLLMAGAEGKRLSLPNSEIMIHQPLGGAQGQATDIAIRAENILKLKERLNKLYAKHTGKKLSEVEKAMERDNYMTPDEALKFGLIDKIIDKRPVDKKKSK